MSGNHKGNFFYRNMFARVILCIAVTLALVHIVCLAEDNLSPAKVPPPVLKKAVLCEKVLNSTRPINEGVVFSASLGRLVCFTYFEPVYEETVIYHKFYFKDKLSSKFKLALDPPRYAQKSIIYLRESDKGPWRVEITDADDNIFSTIRFSITD